MYVTAFIQDPAAWDKSTRPSRQSTEPFSTHLIDVKEEIHLFISERIWRQPNVHRR